MPRTSSLRMMTTSSPAKPTAAIVPLRVVSRRGKAQRGASTLDLVSVAAGVEQARIDLPTDRDDTRLGLGNLPHDDADVEDLDYFPSLVERHRLQPPLGPLRQFR